MIITGVTLQPCFENHHFRFSFFICLGSKMKISCCHKPVVEILDHVCNTCGGILFGGVASCLQEPGSSEVTNFRDVDVMLPEKFGEDSEKFLAKRGWKIKKTMLMCGRMLGKHKMEKSFVTTWQNKDLEGVLIDISTIEEGAPMVEHCDIDVGCGETQFKIGVATPEALVCQYKHMIDDKSNVFVQKKGEIGLLKMILFHPDTCSQNSAFFPLRMQNALNCAQEKKCKFEEIENENEKLKKENKKLKMDLELAKQQNMMKTVLNKSLEIVQKKLDNRLAKEISERAFERARHLSLKKDFEEMKQFSRLKPEMTQKTPAKMDTKTMKCSMEWPDLQQNMKLNSCGGSTLYFQSVPEQSEWWFYVCDESLVSGYVCWMRVVSHETAPQRTSVHVHISKKMFKNVTFVPSPIVFRKSYVDILLCNHSLKCTAFGNDTTVLNFKHILEPLSKILTIVFCGSGFTQHDVSKKLERFFLK